MLMKALLLGAMILPAFAADAPGKITHAAVAGTITKYKIYYMGGSLTDIDANHYTDVFAMISKLFLSSDRLQLMKRTNEPVLDIPMAAVTGVSYSSGAKEVSIEWDENGRKGNMTMQVRGSCKKLVATLEDLTGKTASH
jgi:hypothetical protein